jgi:hypothetical protein
MDEKKKKQEKVEEINKADVEFAEEINKVKEFYDSRL